MFEKGIKLWKCPAMSQNDTTGLIECVYNLILAVSGDENKIYYTEINYT